MLQRYTGSILGLAVGDALGAPVESLKAGHIQQLAGGEVADYLDPVALMPDRPGKWRLPGLHTDDTQQALAVADTLAMHGDVDLAYLRDTFLRMADEGPAAAPLGAHRGTGHVFRRALEAMRTADDPRDAGQPSAGNGAAMRIAPLGLAFAREHDLLARAVAEVSLLTHHDPRGLAAAYAIALAVALAATRDDAATPDAAIEIAEALSPAAHAFEELLEDEYLPYINRQEFRAHTYTLSRCLEILPALVREGRDDLAEKTLLKQANDAGPDRKIGNPQDGFAPMCVPFALYRALAAPDFLTPMLATVNAGGDTDTVGAMVGAVAGARFGEGAIPEHWRKGLVAGDQVRLRGRALYEKEIDWSAWEDLVMLEIDLTERELAHIEKGLRENKKDVEKRRADNARKQQRKAEKAPAPDPGFAPPPEVWLRDRPGEAPPPDADFDRDLDPIESAKLRARRGHKRIAWKEERREKQRHQEDDGDED